MTAALRKDGKPFASDNRGAVPHYIIENNEEGLAILINQFTCDYELIGERPLHKFDPRLQRAHMRLRTRERD